MDQKIVNKILEFSQVALLFFGVFASSMCAIERLNLAINSGTYFLVLGIVSVILYLGNKYLSSIIYGKWMGLFLVVVMEILLFIRFQGAVIKGVIVIINSFLKLFMKETGGMYTLIDYHSDELNYSNEYVITLVFLMISIGILAVISINFYKRRNAGIFLATTLPLFAVSFLVGRVGSYRYVLLYALCAIAIFGTGHFREHKLLLQVKQKVSLILIGIGLCLAVISLLIYTPVRYEASRKHIFDIKTTIVQLSTWNSEDIYSWLSTNFGGGTLNYGDLTGINQVVYTGRKLAEVKYDNTLSSDLYLKGYIGDKYEDGKWTTYQKEDTAYHADKLKCMIGEVDFENIYRLVGWSSTSHMTIKNVGLGRGNRLVPYRPIGGFFYDDSGKIVFPSYGVEYGVDYVEEDGDLLKSALPELNKRQKTKKIADFVRKYYLQVPKGYATKEFKDFMSWKEKDPVSARVLQGFDPTKQNQEQVLMKVAGVVMRYLNSRTEYTLSPGAVPNGKSIMDYFLNVNKKGYCVHYATAGCLLLRSLGIPARYVEGVHVSAKQVKETSSTKKIVVRDKNAHAWVEIYVEGFGFVKYDMTKPSDIVDEGAPLENGGDTPQGNMSTIATPAPINESSDQNEQDNQEAIDDPTMETQAPDATQDSKEENLDIEDLDNNDDAPEEEESAVAQNEKAQPQTSNSFIKALLITLLALIGFAVVVHGQLLIRRYVYKRTLAKKNTNGQVLQMYFHIRPLLKKMKVVYQSEEEQAYKDKLVVQLGISEENAQLFSSLLLKASFGTELAQNEYKEFRGTHSAIKKSIKKSLPWYRRLWYRYVGGVG